MLGFSVCIWCRTYRNVFFNALIGFHCNLFANRNYFYLVIFAHVRFYLKKRKTKYGKSRITIFYTIHTHRHVQMVVKFSLVCFWLFSRVEYFGCNTTVCDAEKRRSPEYNCENRRCVLLRRSNGSLTSVITTSGTCKFTSCMWSLSLAPPNRFGSNDDVKLSLGARTFKVSPSSQQLLSSSSTSLGTVSDSNCCTNNCCCTDATWRLLALELMSLSWFKGRETFFVTCSPRTSAFICS